MLSLPVLGLLFESNRQRYNGDLKKENKHLISGKNFF